MWGGLVSTPCSTHPREVAEAARVCRHPPACCPPGWDDEQAVREGAKTVHERKGRTVTVMQDHPPTASSALGAVIKRTTFDSRGSFIRNCFPKGMPPSLISPALFARDKALLKLPSGHKDFSVGTEQVGSNYCCQGRIFALRCPAFEIRGWAASSFHQGSKTGGSLQIKQSHKVNGARLCSAQDTRKGVPGSRPPPG